LSGHGGPCHCSPISALNGRKICPTCAPGELERFVSRGIAAQAAVDKLTAPAPPFEFGAVCDVCGELVAGTKRKRHVACEPPARGCGAPLAPWHCGELMPVGSVALCDRCAGIK
jgi:hypothetical protein